MMVGGSWFYGGWLLPLSDSAVLDRKCLMDNAGPKKLLKKAQKERRKSAEMGGSRFFTLALNHPAIIHMAVR